MKTVGIIGAGPSGLCGIKHSLDSGFVPICWELNPVIGGEWVYTDRTGLDENGLLITSNAYKNLKTITAREITRFTGFPMTEGEKSYTSHREVLAFLNRFSKEFSLAQYVKFQHYVVEVEPVFKNDPKKTAWRVTTENLHDKQRQRSTYEVDFLIVACGHNTIPCTPDIKDVEIFRGTTLHCRDYRTNVPFKGKKVAVLGNGSSCRDISRDISLSADKVYVCHRGARVPYSMPEKMTECQGIQKATEKGFILEDNSFIEADVLVYCTGYKTTFDFLKESCEVTVENNKVSPLYNHMMHAKYPTMAIVGLIDYAPAFTLIDVHVRYVMEFFKNNIALPSEEEINMHFKKEEQMRIDANLPLSKYHGQLPPTRFRIHVESLEKEASLEPLPKNIFMMFEHMMDLYANNFYEYRNLNYKIINDNNFTTCDIK